VCYTDGLIEDRRRDITEGLTALAEALRRPGASTAEETCAAVQAALASTARHDDICLLTARLTTLLFRGSRLPRGHHRMAGSFSRARHHHAGVVFCTQGGLVRPPCRHNLAHRGD